MKETAAHPQPPDHLQRTQAHGQGVWKGPCRAFIKLYMFAKVRCKVTGTQPSWPLSVPLIKWGEQPGTLISALSFFQQEERWLMGNTVLCSCLPEGSPTLAQHHRGLHGTVHPFLVSVNKSFEPKPLCSSTAAVRNKGGILASSLLFVLFCSEPGWGRGRSVVSRRPQQSGSLWP